MIQVLTFSNFFCNNELLLIGIFDRRAAEMIELRIICKSQDMKSTNTNSILGTITLKCCIQDHIFFSFFFFPIFPLTKDRMIPEIGYHASKNLIPFPWDFPTLFEFRWMSFVKNVKKAQNSFFKESCRYYGTSKNVISLSRHLWS